MTKRKRKSPEKKPASPVPAFLLAGIGASARLVGRYPRSVGGIAAFCVTFGFIAANALWYQPGLHPSPLLRTRDVTDFNALAGVSRNPLQAKDPATVTTFKIEREAAPADAGEASTGEVAAAEDAALAPPPETTALVVAVQGELARLGLYEGAADGVIGPRTESAVALFQKSIGLEANGLVSTELLAALKEDTRVTAAVPRERPKEDLDAAQQAPDPVAAAIRSAQKVVVTAPDRKATPPAAIPVSAPAAAAAPVSAAPISAAPISAADAALVMEIQRGLANIAYTDVSVDGVAGEQTRAAIRRFERHYRLPETGEPSEKVLKKLRDIGAL
ncbi:peptidoglycan-binding protein [Rhizobium sp. S-51]|uniref:Peptidoglycan-binding protein n=1 Tax=Rhizobium terricola TaxID=2728849 RepID=A0A7Y0B0H6_9HYPH|nr:peptidoglycan-binding domain-containing protein [Rhizobium terricola]NML76840.1 peptidoglycan-binding protein [Rhizobium terricola]